MQWEQVHILVGTFGPINNMVGMGPAWVELREYWPIEGGEHFDFATNVGYRNGLNASLIIPISVCYSMELRSAIASYSGVQFLLGVRVVLGKLP